jgi:hypothetical protein
MLSSTAPKLTQQSPKANFFELKNSQIARVGLLEKIKFEQWHIFTELRKKTKNINVINLASMLAAFPRMGIFAFEIPQSAIAEKMGELFEMPVPARNTVSKWEKELESLGYLQIPKHVAWRQHKTKIRVLTKSFWNLARKGLEKLSYTCPHVTFCAGKVERVEQVTPKVLTNNNYVTKIRARETIGEDSKQQNRAVSCKKIESRKFERPPKNNTTKPKRLNKFENSIGFWLFQNKNVESYREAVILFSKFLQIVATDDYCGQLRKNWSDCTDAARPGMVTALINFLRSLPEHVPPKKPAPVPNPEKSSPPITAEEPTDENPERAALRLALFFGTPYSGRFEQLVKHFKNSDPDEQDFIIERFCAGAYV